MVLFQPKNIVVQRVALQFNDELIIDASSQFNTSI